MKTYRIYDIELEFSVRPNDDIYKESYDKEMEIDVPNYVEDIDAYLHQYIIENIEVEFDTPDEPYYETISAYFWYQPVTDDDTYDDDSAVDLYVEQSQMEKK
jgi:hypothetical protein